MSSVFRQALLFLRSLSLPLYSLRGDSAGERALVLTLLRLARAMRLDERCLWCVCGPPVFHYCESVYPHPRKYAHNSLFRRKLGALQLRMNILALFADTNGGAMMPRAHARQDDNADLLEEYQHDAPPAGSDSEAEEDNKPEYHEEAPPQQSAMNAVSFLFSLLFVCRIPLFIGVYRKGGRWQCQNRSALEG